MNTGVSIAFSVAEQLLSTPAYTLFVTHYPQLTSLSSMYTNVKNVHLRTSIDVPLPLPPPFYGQTSSSSRSTSITHRPARIQDQQIKFLYEVTGGPCDMKSG